MHIAAYLGILVEVSIFCIVCIGPRTGIKYLSILFLIVYNYISIFVVIIVVISKTKLFNLLHRVIKTPGAVSKDNFDPRFVVPPISPQAIITGPNN